MGSDTSTEVPLCLSPVVSTHAPAWRATPYYETFVAAARVSTHAPAWGATGENARARASRQVSTHAPAWGATPPPRAPERTPAFQLTLPRGERHLSVGLGTMAYGFQLTLPRGERRYLPCPPFRRSPSFNSRSRVGSDYSPRLPRTVPTVSTHAPAWGATVKAWGRWVTNGVSTHAPAWGATLVKGWLEAEYWFQLTLPRGERREIGFSGLIFRSFNSRSRVGSDVRYNPHRYRRDRVSTHAPAWGATPPRRSRLLHVRGFNSRSRVGSDVIFRRFLIFFPGFNSRSRVGSDNSGGHDRYLG